MHRCLKIPEVLQNILDSHQKLGGAEHHRILTTRSLLAVAITCKLFTEPALDLLWNHVSELSHLFRCLPADMWEVTRDNDDRFGGSFFVSRANRSCSIAKLVLTMCIIKRLTRQLEGSDWDKFDFYARRIKSLQLTRRFGGVHVDIGVFQALNLSCEVMTRSTLLLRNLRRLTWRPTEGNLLFFVNTIITPHLTTLHLDLIRVAKGDHVAVAGAFDAIGARCQNIEVLSITGCFTPRLSSHLSILLRKLRNICVVDLRQSRLDHHAFSYLGSLPHLRKLHISILDQSHANEVIGNAKQHAFRSLWEFTLNVLHLPLATKLIKTFALTPLTKVEIQVLAAPTSSDMQNLFSALVEHCVPSQIVEVILSNYDNARGGELFTEMVPDGFLERRSIQPLFGLPNLESLKIEGQMDPRHIDNAVVKEMVTAWPKLRHLDLLTSYGGIWPSNVDIDGLAMFAACRQLDTLGIPINASSIADDIPLDLPGNGIPCKCLRFLTLGRSPIRYPKPIAAVLSDIFPNLTKIEAFEDFNEEEEDQLQHDLWQECIKLYSWFMHIRKRASPGNVSIGDGL